MGWGGGLFTDSRSESNQEKNGGVGKEGLGCGGGGGQRCISPENMSYLGVVLGGGWGRGGGSRGRRGRGRRDGRSPDSQTLSDNSTSQALFFSFPLQKELAGGVVNLFPM